MGAYDLGFVHPTGYPLYLTIAHLFTRLPIGNIGLRVNLMSAVFASLTVGILFKIAFQHSRNLWAAITVSALIATGPLYWSQAIRAEVYTFHMFLMAGAIYSWRIAAQENSKRHYYITFVFLGLGLGNHMTSILLWFTVLVSAYWLETDIRRNTVPASLLGLVLAALTYLYFPWRAQASLQIDYIRPYFSIDPGSLHGVWWMISGKTFHCLLTPPSGWSLFIQEFNKLAALIWAQTLGFGLFLGIWGWWVLRGSQGLWNRFLTIYLFANLIMFLAYGAIDKEVMFLPIYFLIGIWAAQGIQSLVLWICARQEALKAKTMNAIVNVFLLSVILAGAYFDWPSITLKDDRRTVDFARAVLDQVPPQSTIVSHWATASVFDYLIYVEEYRSDVRSMNIDFYFLGIQQDCQPVTDQQLLDIGWIDWLAAASEGNRLCFIEPLHQAPDGYRWDNQGLCWGLFRMPEEGRQ